LIRNLSVFLSHLKTICRPRSANLTVCTQAAEAIALSLEEVLDVQPPGGASTSTQDILTAVPPSHTSLDLISESVFPPSSNPLDIDLSPSMFGEFDFLGQADPFGHQVVDGIWDML
jgi:hypothetical protein